MLKVFLESGLERKRRGKTLRGPTEGPRKTAVGVIQKGSPVI